MQARSIVAVFFVLLAVAWAAAHAAQPQKTCPPCRQSLEGYGKSLYVTHRTLRVYVCCEGCAVKMQRFWDGYLGVMAELGETAETVKASKVAEGDAPSEPVITNPNQRGVCKPCMGGACERPQHKPRAS